MRDAKRLIKLSSNVPCDWQNTNKRLQLEIPFSSLKVHRDKSWGISMPKSVMPSKQSSKMYFTNEHISKLEPVDVSIQIKNQWLTPEKDKKLRENTNSKVYNRWNVQTRCMFVLLFSIFVKKKLIAFSLLWCSSNK